MAKLRDENAQLKNAIGDLKRALAERATSFVDRDGDGLPDRRKAPSQAEYAEYRDRVVTLDDVTPPATPKPAPAMPQRPSR